MMVLPNFHDKAPYMKYSHKICLTNSRQRLDSFAFELMKREGEREREL